MTSEEISSWARDTRLESDAQNAITDFLYETDIVKFANVTPSLDEIDTITRQASDAKEWRTLDMVWSILSLGIFAAVKAYKAQGSSEALDRVGSIRSEIRKLRGDPDNEISRLLQLRDTIDHQISPNI